MTSGSHRRSAALLLVVAIATWTSSGHASQRENRSSVGDIPREFAQPAGRFDFILEEHMIRMRDGIRLNTIVVRPKQPQQPLPILLTRTPYGAHEFFEKNVSTRAAMSIDAAYRDLVERGYVCVFQDARGRSGSEGTYIVNRPLRDPLSAAKVDHATDTYDTIEWLVGHVPNNNGSVGVTGVSYDGFLTLMAMLEPHPALKAIAPVNAMVDVWIGDDWYHNGAFRQTYALEFIHSQTTSKEWKYAIPFGYRDTYAAFLAAGSAANAGRIYGLDQLPAWNRIIGHPAYTQHWQGQALQKVLAGNDIALKVAVLNVHGLFDQEDSYGPIAAYAALEAKDVNNDRNHLVLGPWYHGQSQRDGAAIGGIKWHQDTARSFRDNVLIPFWDQHLKGLAPTEPMPPVLAFDTGLSQWFRYASWPPPTTSPTKLYLRRNEALARDAPAGADASFTEYTSDPAKPVPYRALPIPGTWAEGSTWKSWLVDDQRQIATRPDVISFTTEPLTVPLTVAGEVTALLEASTSGTDVDWVVKLIDVFPPEHYQQPELGGYQLMVSADILRGRYRESFATAQPVARDTVLPYRVRMPHASHTFRTGHRVMVQIQSTWFPLYDRNPQQFVDNIAFAPPDSYRQATHRIHHSAPAASYIDLPVQQSDQAQRP